MIDGPFDEASVIFRSPSVGNVRLLRLTCRLPITWPVNVVTVNWLDVISLLLPWPPVPDVGTFICALPAGTVDGASVFEPKIVERIRSLIAVPATGVGPAPTGRIW